MDEGVIRYPRKIDWLSWFTHSDMLFMEPLTRWNLVSACLTTSCPTNLTNLDRAISFSFQDTMAVDKLATKMAGAKVSWQLQQTLTVCSLYGSFFAAGIRSAPGSALLVEQPYNATVC